jgi:pimeloyl-ACP methyl ester carboxylesterase
MESSFVALDSGLRLQVWTLGSPDAPPVVALHALGEAGTDWAQVAGALVEDGYRVIAPDLRGHGGSDWPEEYSYDSIRDDIVGLLDALELERPILMGHSLGGAVALVVAQSEPDRISRLIVEDAPPPFPRERACPARPDVPLPFDWQVVESVYQQMNDPTRRWWPGLQQITAPTLVIGGGQASTIPQDQLAAVAALIPDCELVTIEAGHLVHDAEPEQVIQTVRGWLAGWRDWPCRPR